MPVVNEGEGVMEWSPGVRWGKALVAGFVAGAVLLIIPWGSPWAGITFTSPAIMGRAVLPQTGLSYFEAALLHFGVSCVYAVILALLVSTFRPDRALVIGAMAGIGLYFLNFLVFRFMVDGLIGPEWPVALAHLFFGLLTTAIYRGTAKRRAPDVPPGATS